ncbi:MAG: hypothetical protein ACK502_00580 [Alphaproteobacteria bacterium]
MATENQALNQRYADRFLAFIGNTNENERQAHITDELLHQLSSDIPDIFTRHDHQKLDIVDLGCGPGEMAKSFQAFFETVNIEGARVNAFELNREHMVSAQRAISDSVVVPEDIFHPQKDIRGTLGLKSEPAAIFVSHSGYYGYDKNYGSDNQPKLEALVDNVAGLMGKRTIAFIQHKAPEPTNILKRKYANIVESDTTEALSKIFNKRGMKSFPVRFEAVLEFPQVEEGLWKELENPKPYPQTDYENGKEVRDLLEFLIHKGLEEMTHNDRINYLADAKKLIREYDGAIPTFIEQRVVISKDADRSFREEVKSVVDKVAKKHFSEMQIAT